MALFLGRRLDYRASGHEELRKFVRDRTKQDIGKEIRKDDLVLQLEALDRKATFPLGKSHTVST